MPTGHATRNRTRVSTRRAPAPPPPGAPGDDDLASCTEKVRALPDVRWEKVRAVRAALAEGGYDVEGRLSELIDRLPAELHALVGRR